MNCETKRPERRWTVTLNVGADEWDDAAHELMRLAEHVREHGPGCSQVSGSPSVGSSVDIVSRPDMTHERYFAELDAYLDEERWTRSGRGDA